MCSRIVIVNSDVWTLLVRHVNKEYFEEMDISRMKGIQYTDKHYKRKEIPRILSKKYDGDVNQACFKVDVLIDRILNRFPIDSFDFQENTLCIDIRKNESLEDLLVKYPELQR